MTLQYPNHKKKESLSHLIIKNIPESSPPQHVLLYLHQFFNCKIITDSSLPPVAPGEPINCHAVFPLMWQKMSRIIAVAAGIVATMLADGTSSPAVIGDYRVPNWAEIKTRVSLQEKKNTLETKGNVPPNRSSLHPLPTNDHEKSDSLCVPGRPQLW